MRIVVTGGSGLIGRRITARLATEHEVVNVDLRVPDLPVGVHVRADILDAEAVARSLEGADAVVHAAAIAGPSMGVAEDIYITNVNGTRVVSEAARTVGVGRFVNISSEAVLGFVFGAGRIKPRYFPIDEDHPVRASEPYGRSKMLAEELLAETASDGATVVSLRPPWVWVPEEYAKHRRLIRNPEEWWDGLWAYVHGDDLAEAVRRAIVLDIPQGFHSAYVAAPDNGTVYRTRELIERFYPEVPVRPGIGEFGSLISSRHVGQLLGFQPSLTWRQFLD
jgi:nucleoside-diphosphate-sugar epimerase